MPDPRPVVIELSEAERERLESWSRRRSSAQALAERARIVLAAADGLNNTEIAARLGVDVSTARRWRNRFGAQRLEGLTDEPRPGQPRKITDAKVEEVIVKTLESTPRDATHWSTRSMAAEVGLNQSAVHRIWKAFGLQPHRQDTWKLSKDPQFIEKVRDVVGLYLNPPERAVVLCVDEKSQIQALDRTAPILPMLPGVPERATHDYKRSGTSSLYAALELTSGKVIGRLHRCVVIARSSSGGSWPRSIARSQPSSTCMSCSTTAQRTRRRRSRNGCSRTPASSCTSPRPAARG